MSVLQDKRADRPLDNRSEAFIRRWLPSWLVEKVPRDHRISDAEWQRQRRIVAVTAAVGAPLLGVSLTSKPGSTRFYAAGLGVAAVYLSGGLSSGPVHLGYQERPDHGLVRPVAAPAGLGVFFFCLFYVVAMVCRRIPILDRALRSVLQFADAGSPALNYTTTLTNGVAEEVFFRGAMFAAIGVNQPVAKSTLIYGAGTVPTRNPALVLAALVMGTVFGLQRRATGGIQAPLITHIVWSSLMARFLPPLFTPRARPEDRPDRR